MLPMQYMHFHTFIEHIKILLGMGEPQQNSEIIYSLIKQYTPKEMLLKSHIITKGSRTCLRDVTSSSSIVPNCSQCVGNYGTKKVRSTTTGYASR